MGNPKRRKRNLDEDNSDSNSQYSQHPDPKKNKIHPNKSKPLNFNTGNTRNNKYIDQNPKDENQSLIIPDPKSFWEPYSDQHSYHKG